MIFMLHYWKRLSENIKFIQHLMTAATNHQLVVNHTHKKACLIRFKVTYQGKSLPPRRSSVDSLEEHNLLPCCKIKIYSCEILSQRLQTCCVYPTQRFMLCRKTSLQRKKRHRMSNFLTFLSIFISTKISCR